MPVFKKQPTEEEMKRNDAPSNELSEEERTMQKKKQDELKFHLHQTKQLLHQQQKQAEAFNLMHPGHIANIYHTHGTIHHVLPHVQEEYDDLMPDPMAYVSLMAPPPPPSAVDTEPPKAQPRFDESDEPVLPPGIDEEEVANMEPVVPDVPAKDVLPKDFQDALSIIFDKDHMPDGEPPTASGDSQPSIRESGDQSQVNANLQDENSTYAAMDIAMDDPNEMDGTAAMMLPGQVELDEQSQYMLYGQMADGTMYGDIAAHIPQGVQAPATDLTTHTNDTTDHTANIDEINSKNIRLQELDDLAMLGIDAEDLAAQCI